jgi:pyridoxal phosphate enzyme (YggS family)
VNAAGRLIWHFIGPLQANKTRGIAEHFDWVQSVDQARLADRLAHQRPAHLPPLQVCIQVNVGAEAGKRGCAPAELAGLAAHIAQLDRLRLRGLMLIPEADLNPSELAARFAAGRALFEGLKRAGWAIDTLSMGMSDDLELAVAEGATMVRVGSALFGPRAPDAA